MMITAGYVTAMFDFARDFAALLRESGDFEPAVEPESNIDAHQSAHDPCRPGSPARRDSGD